MELVLEIVDIIEVPSDLPQLDAPRARSLGRSRATPVPPGPFAILAR